MTKLGKFIETLSDRSRLALATAGILSTLMGTPANAGTFFESIGGNTYVVKDLQTAVAFDRRITDNLADLVDLSRAMQRVNLYGGDMSGQEKAWKIKAAYLYEYSKASYPELQQYDRCTLSLAPGVRDRRVALLTDDANRKKQVLRDGTTLVDEIAEALKIEDYRSVERMVRSFSRMMEQRGVPLLTGRSNGTEMAYDEQRQGSGLTFGR